MSATEHSFSNFPFRLEAEGTIWCCGMPDCGKRIAREKKSGITYHKYTHFPKLVCEHCSATFPQKIALEQHIRINHTDERPYSCEHCDKAFHQLSNLQDHVAKHHGAKVPPKPKIVEPKVAATKVKANMTIAYANFCDAQKEMLRKEQPQLRGAALTSEIARRWRAAKATLLSNEHHASPIPRENPGTEFARIPLCHLSDTTTDHDGVDILEEIDIILRGDM
jgi:uncharacterized Zn-finger protein